MSDFTPPPPNNPERWGPADQLGAANLVDAVLSPATLALAGEGRVLDLSQPISHLSPRLDRVMSPYSMCMWSHPLSSRHHLQREMGIMNEMGYADERVEFDLHTGTHIDALGHAWIGDRTYNGRSMRDVVTNWGLRELGIEHLPPVVARGVFFDVPAHRGRALEPGEVVTVADLEGIARTRGIAIRSGDVVFVRTGWAQYYAGDPATYSASWPGIGVDAAAWLAERDVAIVGGDTIGLEVYPDEVPTVHSPVHQLLLASCGIYILEQADLDPLAEREINEFLCLCLAPRFVGGTASPVRLVGVA
jgi:kynurenine formamidase